MERISGVPVVGRRLSPLFRSLLNHYLTCPSLWAVVEPRHPDLRFTVVEPRRPGLRCRL